MKAKNNSSNFQQSSLITYKNENFLVNQRKAGKIAAQTIQLLENLVNNKSNLSLAEMNQMAENYITSHNAIPTFKNYKNSFPAGVCISVNKQLVHGIPSDYRLQEGDLVSFDLGATVEGSIADTATTCLFGSPKSPRHSELIAATKQVLNEAIKVIAVGKRVGVIGEKIYQIGRQNDFSVVSNYGGHGIEITAEGVGIPHGQPFISNKSTANEGVRIQQNMTIAIEPLFVLGHSNKTRVMDDGWTVECENICAHEEHTIFIHSDRVEVITSRE